MSDYVIYIKSCWLAGNTRQDTAAEIIRLEVLLIGFCKEEPVFRAIDAVYNTLNIEYFNALVNRQIETSKAHLI